MNGLEGKKMAGLGIASDFLFLFCHSLKNEE